MPFTGRGVTVARRIVGKSTASNISEEIRNVRTAGTPPVLQRAIAIEVISDPFSLTQEYIDELATSVNNPQIIDVMPVNSLVARLISANQGIDGTGNIILFPFFSSHFLLPVNPGEVVYVIFENYQTLGTKIGYWLTRTHAPRTVEDLNYTHLDRMYQVNLNPGNYSTSERTDRPDESNPPGFPNGAGTAESVSITPAEENADAYQNIIDNSLTYPLTTPEAIPRWIKRPQELVVQGSNNALIMLGEDRNGSIYGASGSNPIDIKGSAGTIDLVTGRGRYKAPAGENPGDDNSPTSCRVIVNERGNEENDKAPHTRNQNNTENVNEGNPDPVSDAARIYITQQSNVDLNYLLAGNAEGVQEYPSDALPPVQPDPTGDLDQYNRSYVVSKADHIRIIARKDEEKEINGTVLIIKHGTPAGGGVGDAPAADEDLAYIYINEEGKIQIDGNRIYFGRTAGDGEQPYIKFTEYETTIKKLHDQIKNLRDDYNNFKTLVKIAFNAATAIPYSPVASLQSSGGNIQDAVSIESIQSEIDACKSTKIFGE